MPDTDQTTAGAGSSAAGVFVPLQTEQSFPELLKLIQASESMNDAERQYWIDILPVMTTEQIDQLKGILQNEHDQLAAIDKKYGKEIDSIKHNERELEEISKEHKERHDARSAKEEEARKQEKDAADEILKEIE